MKLLRVIATVDPKTGGPIEGLKRASEKMLDRGVDVEIATLNAPGAFADEVRKLPWVVHTLGPSKFGAYAYSPAFIPWLEKNLKRFDAVIVHGIWQYHGFATAKVCRRLNVPYFVYPHGMLDPWFNRTYPIKRLKKQLYWRWGEHPVLSHAESVLFTSEEECRLARGSFRPYRINEAVIGYGTSAPDVDCGDLKRRLSEKSPRWAARPFFLFLGRIQEKKGLDLLVGSYSSLRRTSPNIPDLVIAGPVQQDSYAARIKDSFPQDGIHWVGPIAGEEKWQALAAAEALVLVSHQENFGLVVAEALAVGTPVLISDKINIWREIIDGGAGLAAADTSDGATQLLADWVDLSTDRKNEMGIAARAVFREQFEIGKATERLIDHITASLKN